MKKQKLISLLIGFLTILLCVLPFLFFCSIHFLLGILWLIFFLLLRSKIVFSLPSGACYLWLGVPGSGKTTIAAYISKHYLENSDYRVFSNVPIKGTLKYNWKYHFGKYDMSHSIVICDEAGIYLNGRNWKNNFSDDSIETIKKFRHYDMTLHFFSQANDEDPVIRNLSVCTYVVERCTVKWFVKYRAIISKVDILDSTRKHDYLEAWKPFSTKFVFCPPVWKLFDTLECKPLPERDWETW